MNKWGKLGTGAAVVGITGVVAFGAVALFSPAAAKQPQETVAAYVMTDPASLDTANGLAAEQEAAGAAEVARIAAEAEAARVAAEQAAQAAAEASRIAEEQAATEADRVADETTIEGSDDGDTPSASNGAPSGTAVPFYPSSDPNNATGGDYADPGSFCASGSASTVNGVPTCD